MVGELAAGFLGYDELKLLVPGQTFTLLFDSLVLVITVTLLVDRLVLVTELSSWPLWS